MQRWKKKGSLIVTVVLLLSVLSGVVFPQRAFADYEEKVESQVESKFNELVDVLKQNPSTDNNYIVTKFLSNEKNVISDNELAILNKDSTKDEVQILNIVEEKEVNGMSVILYENGIFSVDTIEVDESLSNPLLRATTKTKTSNLSKTYYLWVGFKLFTIAMACKFSYNGSKASYHSLFDAGYERGNFSIWQVSNFKKWKEQAGTSYNAYCSGNFHIGIDIKGIGLVIKDMYIKGTMSCSKNGTISQSFND